eukprot:gene19109-24943_t
MFLQLFVINKSGGVIFNRNLSNLAPNLSDNENLRLGSTFHGLHAIATQVAPIVSLVTTSHGSIDSDELLTGVYELYSDYVLKNPFYEMDMPIRSEIFNKNLDKLVSKISTLAPLKKKP